jgi:Carboxypeptidase regulatory-like domain
VIEGEGAEMLRTLFKQGKLVWMAALFAAVVSVGMPSSLAAATDMTTVHVQVNDAQTGDPIYQARLTLRFREPGRFMRRSQIISYTSKTDKNGKAQIPVVPMGTITLMVTAPDHNTFGKEFEITKQNQKIEVKLQKPHPVL